MDGAPATLDSLRAMGRRLVFVTNNSWRTPAQVARKLVGMGIHAEADEVVTSGQATASLLARESESGRATAFVLGGEGIRSALAEAGIEPADGQPDRVDFVVVGWDRDLTYERLRTATVLVGRGARLVATNSDASYPAPGGELWPGAGAILAAVEAGSGRRATVVGKPHRPLFDLATERAGSRRVLVVGDRLETDIEGAGAAGLDAAFVLTGASTAADLVVSDAAPAMVLENLGGLLDDRPAAPSRPAEASDEASVRRLVERAGLADGVTWDPEAATIVVESAGELAATGAADVRGPDAYLRSVAVRADLRGTRLGTLAVAAAVRHARRRGARRAWLVTETASGFFAGLGFQPLRRGSLPGWIEERSSHCRVSAVSMVRDLGQ